MKAINTIWLQINLVLLLWQALFRNRVVEGQITRNGRNCKKCESDHDCDKGRICGFNRCCDRWGNYGRDMEGGGKFGKECNHISHCREQFECLGVNPGYCLTLPKNGEATICEKNYHCWEGFYCRNGRCVELKSLGSKCESSEECKESHCLPAIFSIGSNQKFSLKKFPKYCSVRTQKLNEKCNPKKQHCDGNGLICTISVRRKGKKVKENRIPRGRRRCKKDSADGTNIECRSNAECPCGEACLTSRGQPIDRSRRREGNCKRAKCGRRTNCIYYGFPPSYTCKEKICMPPQVAMRRVIDKRQQNRPRPPNRG